MSASERAAGEIKQALQDLLKAVDSDGDAAISDSEAARFVEVLKQVQASGASGGSDRAAGGRQQADASTGASDLADQVMRLYARAGEGTDPSARAGRLSVAA